MSTVHEDMLVDWPIFAQARAQLGGNFVRILGYFKEDGIKSVEEVEAALRANSAAAMVLPAHTLKGEARQFGAEPLAECAAAIEEIARTCVEKHYEPSEALNLVVELRPLFEVTLVLLEREASPLVERRPVFGRRV